MLSLKNKDRLKQMCGFFKLLTAFWKHRTGRKEMFYLTTNSVHLFYGTCGIRAHHISQCSLEFVFNDTLNTFLSTAI